MAKILLVDDDAAVAQPFAENLREWSHTVVVAENTEQAKTLLAEARPDLVITDIRLHRDDDGLEVLREAKRVDPALPVILITGFATEKTAREALSEGAYHYLGKPLEYDERLEKTVQNAIDYGIALRQSPTTARASQSARQQGEKKYRFDAIIGSSEAMKRVFEIMKLVAETDTTILILGESGTGKELVARALHFNSRRVHQAFVTINCAALPEQLLESELFGHKRGSFTGAVADKKGLFEEAEGGTIFLDEIGLMSLPLQGKLLRVLQEKELRRVGDNVTRKVDVRVLAAAQHSLKEKVKMGAFREDLYYRLSVIPIEIPPLRERREDIPSLVQHFLKQRSKDSTKVAVRLSEEVMDIFQRYSWPGNVRELENVLERGCTLCTDGVMRFKNLPPALVAASALAPVAPAAVHTPAPEASAPKTESPAPVAPSAAVAFATPATLPDEEKPLRKFLAQQEEAYLRRVLARHGGDKVKAARALGVSLATLYRKLGSEEPSAT